MGTPAVDTKLELKVINESGGKEPKPENDEARPDGQETYPSGPKLILTMLALYISMFLIALVCPPHPPTKTLIPPT